MFPLLVKDKLRVPYLACCGLYLALTCLLDGPVSDSTVAASEGAKKQTMERLYAKLAYTTGDIARQMGWLGELLAIEPVKSVLIGLSAFGEKYNELCAMSRRNCYEDCVSYLHLFLFIEQV